MARVAKERRERQERAERLDPILKHEVIGVLIPQGYTSIETAAESVRVHHGTIYKALKHGLTRDVRARTVKALEELGLLEIVKRKTAS